MPTLKKITFYLFYVRCVNIHVPWPLSRDQRTTCMSCFSLSSMWVLGIDLESQAWLQTHLPLSHLTDPSVPNSDAKLKNKLFS